MLDTPSIVPFSRTEREKIQLSFERDQSITRASSRLRPSTRDSVRSEHVSFRLLTNSKPARLDRSLFHIRIIAFSFLENGPRIHENTVIRSRETEREHPATLLPGGNLRRNLGFNVRIHPREIFMGEEVHVPTISDSFRGTSYHVAS